ncbi:MAG: PAS domain-containing sensor histidine kinase [Lachnospiraceae bacterium]|nr:PAS domain-containing sensor histidine kinase [Lachnospiraceae bacterium]
MKKRIWNLFTRITDRVSLSHTFDAHHSLLFTVCAMLAATVLSTLYRQLNATDSINVALIYILAIILISYHTDLYRYGVISGLVSVFLINGIFTYPYWEVSFEVSGSTITFAIMYIISILSSATVFRMKEQARKLKENEKLIVETEKEKEKEKLRANLLRAVSHDLRTPLTSMIGASSSCLENEDSLTAEEKRQLISQIYEDANWLLHVVENLLSVTRITEGGASVLKKTSEPMEEVLFDAIATARKRYPDLKVETVIPDELLVAPMDPLLIKQVILNLLENSYFHAHSAQPVKCTLDSTDTFVNVHIRDFGEGIAPERLAGIFDAAPSAPTSASDTRKGMGIGLSICKAIIAAHDGEITVRNCEPGAEFCFRIPKEEKAYESDR